MSDLPSQDLVEDLRAQIEQEMVGVHITHFTVKRDVDHDGDPILRFQIAYDEAGDAPQATQVSALTRHIRPRLEQDLPNTFPVFRFLTARELADEAS